MIMQRRMNLKFEHKYINFGISVVYINADPKKSNKKFSDIRLLYELSFFSKKSKKLSNIQLSKELPFFPKRSKRSKRPRKLTKHQILKDILPLYDSVGISWRERAFRGYIET